MKLKELINYIKYSLFVLIILLLLDKQFNKLNKIGYNVEYFNNRKISESILTNPSSKVYYLYWTGGFDSTFRLCEMLINENKIVQPIYISLVLDNDCKSEETCNKLWLRRNRKEEKLAMKKIIKTIKNKFPHIKNNILPIIIVDEDIKDNVFNYNYDKLFYSKNVWPAKRKKHQYLFLTKYAFYYKTYIDIGVLGIHTKSKLAQFLNTYLHKYKDGSNSNVNYRIEVKNHPLSYLCFPLFGRSKENLLDKAVEYNYDNILKMTWSCWFPDNGKACKKCPMCKERIIGHPDND